MKNANIHEARTNLSKLIKLAMNGEEVIISNAGRPVARLVPFSTGSATRVPGRDLGAVTIRGDFDDPLSKEILRDFEK